MVIHWSPFRKEVVCYERGQYIAEKMLIEVAESRCPIFRATTPLSKGKLKSKGNGNFSIHCGATQETLRLFRRIVSANQLSLFGAVAEMSEEY